MRIDKIGVVMVKKINVKPVTGVDLIDPLSNRMVPEGGLTVRDSIFWRRRIRDGDAILVEDESPKPDQIKKPKKAEQPILDDEPETEEEI